MINNQNYIRIVPIGIEPIKAITDQSLEIWFGLTLGLLNATSVCPSNHCIAHPSRYI